LVEFEGEDGRTLYDLPDAPRPDAGTAAPVRFLPDLDNAILGYAERSRIVGKTDEARLTKVTRSFRSLLVDGYVAATWAIARHKSAATLTITPFRKLLKREMRDIETEGTAFLKFMEPDSSGRDVQILAVAD
jgi:hypothetical protein